MRLASTASLVALCSALSISAAKICEGAQTNIPSGFVAWKWADGQLGVNRDRATLLMETRAESLIDCVKQCTMKAGCVHASWEMYGSCAGYDVIMEKVEATPGTVFQGAAKKGTCEDDESKAISDASGVECCEIQF